MADSPIKYSEFIQPDDSVSNLISQLETLQKTYEKILNEIRTGAKRAEDALKATHGATTDSTEATKKAAEEAEKLKKANDDLIKSRSENAKKIATLKSEQQKQNQLNKLNIKLNNSLEGSYDKLSAQYSLNKIRLNAMSKAEREATKAGRDLEEQTAEIYEEMKRLQEATGKHTLSVGDYEKGWKGVKDELKDLPGAAGSAAGGLDGISASAKKLLANPLVLLISAIIVGLTTLFSLFKRTKTGADLLAKGTAVLSGILSALVGLVDQLTEGLIYVFNNPKKAIKEFGESLKNNIINRFLGVIRIVKSLGAALESLWERDLAGLEEAAKNAGSALIQMNTGLDEQQQKDFAESIRNTTKAIYDQAEAFAILEQSRRDVRRANRELEKQLQDLITQEELLKSVADDATKSFSQREIAAKKASELTVQRSGIQLKIAKSNLDLLNQEVDLRAKNGEYIEDLLDQQLDSYKALKEAQRDYLLVTSENQTRESQLKQDRLEKDLDILIDGFDNQKAINERLINDDSRTYDERKKILDKTKSLFEDTFAKQIETIQKFTSLQINANDLINESDAVVLNQKIRSLGLSEIIEGRLLEIVRERRIATQDLFEIEKDLNDKKIKSEEESLKSTLKLRKQEYESTKSFIDQNYELRLSEIEVLKNTEAEKTRLRLEAEKERLQKILDLNKSGLGELSALQINTVKNTIKKIQNEIDSPGNTDYDLYSLSGLELEDDKKQVIAESTNFAIGEVSRFLQSKIDASNASVESANVEADSAQKVLDSEIQARNEGYASNVSSAQKELALAKKTQNAALENQRKAQKAQNTIESLQQISSLVTASAKIWGQLGFPWAIPAIGVMFGSFALSKVKAAQVAKTKEYGDGGLEILGGGSHESGNDTVIGHNNGYQIKAEKGEAIGIVNKNRTRKYKDILPKVMESFNRGIFEETYGQSSLGGVSINSIYSGKDLTKLENDVNHIKKQGERRYFLNGKGKTIETYKNLKRIYNAN